MQIWHRHFKKKDLLLSFVYMCVGLYIDTLCICVCLNVYRSEETIWKFIISLHFVEAGHLLFCLSAHELPKYSLVSASCLSQGMLGLEM